MGEEYQTIKALRVGAPYAKKQDNKDAIAVDIVRDDKKPATLIVDRALAARINDQRIFRDHENNYTFYVGDNNVAIDIDREAKNPNLPISGATTTLQDDDSEKRVILEVNRAGKVLIGTNINMSTDIAAKMREAVQTAKDNGDDIRDYDILEDTYLVVSVRNEGRRIHVKMN